MEGWTVTSIAEYLQIHRKTVWRTLKRWVEEGVVGMPHKSRARRPSGRRVTLTTLRLVRTLQKNDGLGVWRIHSRFKRIGIRVSPATCGRILALNRALYTLPKPKHSPSEKQAMPFASDKRHKYWPVDMRHCARMLYHLCKRLVQEGTY